MSQQVCSLTYIVNKFDIFSKDIGLTFDRKERYQTFFGGLTSIVALGILTIYFLILIDAPLEVVQSDATAVNSSLVSVPGD